MPTFGSLFAGIGGIDLGLERAGWRCVWQVEIDPFRRAILAKHWPNIPKYGAIEEVDIAQLEIPDLIAGGFPCQPVSMAGRRKAEADSRWLWPEFARVIGLLRPRYVLVENVPGLLTKGMGFVLADLSSLGYDAEWDCIPASFVGAPHIRNRIFIVAYSTSGRWYTQPLLCSSAQTGNGSTNADGSSPAVGGQGWWEVEPGVARVAHGIPNAVDRIRALGDAVVPQVAEYIGRRILETTERSQTNGP